MICRIELVLCVHSGPKVTKPSGRKKKKKQRKAAWLKKRVQQYLAFADFVSSKSHLRPLRWVGASVSSTGSHGNHEPTVPSWRRGQRLKTRRVAHAASSLKAFPGLSLPTRRRSAGGRGWSSCWPGSCCLSCSESVCSWSSSAEPAAPWTRTGRRAGSRGPPGRRNSRRSACSRTGTLRMAETFF